SAVAENENAAKETLDTLSSDEHPDVRYRLAENANTPADILEKLAEDENPYVASRAADTLKGLSSLSERADELLVKERFDEAESMYRNLVMRLEEALGSSHKEVSFALHKMAAALVGQGKMDEALIVEKRAKAIALAQQNAGKK